MTVAPRGLALSLGRLTPLPAVWSRPRNMKRGTLLVVLAALTPMNTDDGGTDPSNYVYFILGIMTLLLTLLPHTSFNFLPRLIHARISLTRHDSRHMCSAMGPAVAVQFSPYPTSGRFWAGICHLRESVVSDGTVRLCPSRCPPRPPWSRRTRCRARPSRQLAFIPSAQSRAWTSFPSQPQGLLHAS